jgi:hypothetical protein
LVRIRPEHFSGARVTTMFQACAQRVAAYQCAIGFVPKTYHEFWHIVITATHMYAPIGEVSIHTVLCIDRSSAAHRPLIDRSSTTGKNRIDRSY